MRKMKKLVSLLLAMVMVLAMTMTVSAEEVEDEKYTITHPGNSHTYEIYQIFTGDLSGNVLSNIKWGVNGTGETGKKVNKDTLDALKAVTESESNTEKLAVIEQYVTLSNPHASLASGTVDVDPGYYLIKDVDNSVTGNDSYTTYIVKIVGDVEISPKADVPEVVKKVDDKNDSNTTEDTTIWQDSADYDIGDAVPFQLTGTLPTNYADYHIYKYVFHDTLSDGLTNIAVTSVYLADENGTKVVDFAAEDYSYSATENGFDITFEDLKETTITAQITASSKIVVEYTAVLDTDANVGATGNPNEVYLEYSNNPNYKGEGEGQPDNPETGKTEKDKVIVFTYKVVVDKVNDKNEPLKGAEFTLSKQLPGEDNWEVIEVITGTDATQFVFSGLDDGIYKLEETKTPAGYNTIDPIIFTVTATHDIDSEDPTLTDLTGNVTTGTITFAKNVAEGSLSTTVVNNAGTVLPETGGMGTTMFYLIGAILVIGAGILLITKKRMSAE